MAHTAADGRTTVDAGPEPESLLVWTGSGLSLADGRGGRWASARSTDEAKDGR